MGLRKEFQTVGNRTLYVDTISVKQVTIFNDFVDSQWFSEPTHAQYSMNSLL